MLLGNSLFKAVISSIVGAVSVGVAEGKLELWLAWGSSCQRSVGTGGKLSRGIATCILILKAGELRVGLRKSSEFRQALVL
jgi:hypothetical protein